MPSRICTFAAWSAAGLLALPGLAQAGEKTHAATAVIEKAKVSCITGDIGLTVVSQYVSKGVVYENQGAILQPYMDLFIKLYEADRFLSEVTLDLGTWSSFHSRRDTGAGVSQTSPRSWYEQDFTVGLSFTFARNFTFSPSYYIFASPNESFDTFHGLNAKLTYDDTDLLGGFALNPYAQVMWELENKFGTGTEEGVNYEIGIAPSFPMGPIAVTFPVTAGFGSHNFYVNELGENEAYGWFSAGINLSYALVFVPERFGTWSVNAGYSYYHLGDGTDYAYTEPDGGTIRDEDEHEHVFQGGIVVAF